MNQKNKTGTMRIRDMTTGEPIKQILLFAVPLFIGNIFQQIYNLVDTSVVGHCIGDNAISAIGATSSLCMLLISVLISLNSGYAIIIAQSFGAHDESKLKTCIAGTFLLNFGTIVLFTLLSASFLKPLMRFMNTPDSIFKDAYDYMFVICIGLFTTVGYNMFAAILRAIGNSRTPLYCLIISSVANVVLDLLFVAVFNMGVVGAAIATVLAQLISAALCGLAFFLNYPRYVPRRKEFQISKRVMPTLLSTGCSMALMMCVVHMGTLIFQRANNALGEACITAYAAGRRIVSIVMQPFGTIADANATFVSQNWGAKQYNRIKTTLRKVMLIEICWGFVACVLMFGLGDSIIRIVTGTENAQIIADAVLCMRANGPFLPILGILLCLRTAMQAMGYKRDPVISSCVELAMKMAGAILVIPSIGFIGSCFTEPVTWVFMTIYLVVAYFLRRKNIFKETI